MKKVIAASISPRRRPRSFTWSITSRTRPVTDVRTIPLGCGCGCKIEKKPPQPLPARA